MTSSDIRTLTISPVSMSIKEQNLFGSPHSLRISLCRNHTGCNKHTLITCFSLSCNLLLALRAMQVMNSTKLLQERKFKEEQRARRQNKTYFDTERGVWP